MNIKEKAKQLKTDIPAIFLCLRSNETPLIAKVLAGITIVYALSPIDLIPDFIPVIGYLDDILILPVLIMLTAKCIPEEMFLRFRKEAEGMWANGKPKSWYYALPVAVIWLLLLFLLLKALGI